ncbi:GGDEF domain-containing response regulator [Butyrivibrio sp. MC2013]|uniref:GGDEF domain-containing response regulator n=1 Tax=Butyrivibrio sp. MC2013 TaxID=1280686 RepID=UPI000412B0F5|nr:diguanylate cyclase [Butyrivibrio sp. MC2013]
MYIPGRSDYILIVDDDPVQLNYVKNKLKDHFECQCAASPEEGIMIALKHRPMLIVTDIMMPGMSGTEMMARLDEEEKTKGIPYIAVTSSDGTDAESKVLKDGASDYIRKPFDAEVLLQRVNNVIRVVKAQNSLRTMAVTDDLTGVYTRRYIENKIDSLADDVEGTFCLLDLDHFKNVNDRFGHEAGDAALCIFARTISRLSRSDDITARIGGDEFVLFFKGCVDRRIIVPRLRRIIERTNEDLEKYDVTVSIGVSLRPSDATSFAELYQRADEALYDVKRSGRGSYKFFDEGDSEDDADSGAMLVSNGDFDNIVEFLGRSNDRVHISKSVLFVTNVGCNNDKCRGELLSFLKQNLRTADVITQSDNSTYTVLLTGTDGGNRDLAIKRIRFLWSKTHKDYELGIVKG